MSPSPTDFHEYSPKHNSPPTRTCSIEPSIGEGPNSTSPPPTQSPHSHPKNTYSFKNRPRCSSLNRIRTSTELFIRISHVRIHFYLHSVNFTSFSFYLQPQFHSVFCIVFFYLITEFELDLYDFASALSQIRALHFSSFTV